MTEEIVGLPEAESRELLDFLFAHQSTGAILLRARVATG
jgi:hypothetical protein